jgi:Dolichyl-phosphate-mannose-protein mannosyltransferase
MSVFVEIIYRNEGECYNGKRYCIMKRKTIILTNDKICYAILSAIILSVFLMNSVSFREGHNWGGDFPQYIAQAKSLNDGTIDRLLENSTFRYEKSDSVLLSPKLYPWGFPILLAPIYRVFGFNIFAMKFFVNLFFLFSIAIVYLMLKGKVSNIQNILIVAIIAFNPYFFNFKEHILSDIPFLFFSLFSVFLIQQFIIKKSFWLNEIFCYLLIGILMFISYTIRVNGIILLPCLFLAQILEHKYSTKQCSRKSLTFLKYSVPYLAFSVLILIMGMILPRGSTYADYFALVTFKGVYLNFIFYAKLLGHFFSTLIPKSGEIIYLMTVPFVIVGLAEKIKKDYLYFAFSIFTVCIYVLAPGRDGLRYLFPIIPFYLYFLFAGLNKINVILSEIDINIDSGLMVGIPLIILFLTTTSVDMYKQYNMKDHIMPGPCQKDSVELFNYISLNTNKDSIIIFNRPRVMTLYTDRKSARIGNFGKIMESGADYIACRQNSQVDLEIQKNGREANKIFVNNAFNFYQLNKEK